MYTWEVSGHKNIVIFPDDLTPLQRLQTRLGVKEVAFPAVFFHMDERANSGDLSFFDQLLPHCSLPKLHFRPATLVILENGLYLLLQALEPNMLEKFQNLINTYYQGLPADVLLPLVQLPPGQLFPAETEEILMENLPQELITLTFDPQGIKLQPPEWCLASGSTL